MRPDLPDKKRGQMIGQVFIYILTLLLVILILIYGYNAISDFRQKTDQVSLVQLQGTLRSSVESISSEFGSVEQVALDAHEFQELCLVESYENPDPSSLGSDVDVFLRDSINSGSEENVFLYTTEFERSFTVPAISVSPDVLCVTPRGGEFVLRLEGKGDHVVVSQWG